MTIEINLKEGLDKLKKLMEEEKIKFPNNEKLKEQLLAVRKDANGEPIPETVGPYVRALVMAVIAADED